MKIGTNTIGNYTPQLNRQPVKPTEVRAKANVVESKPAARVKAGDLTADEKDFFMSMYPQSKTEIVDYHFYQKNGEMSGVKIGSQFDRRG